MTLVCAFPVAGLGVGVAVMSLISFFRNPSLLDGALFVGAVLLAPFFLLYEWWFRSSGAFPASTLAFAIAAIVGSSIHPIVHRRWAMPMTILGAIAWLFCEMIVAGAPA
jgi:hypothetical protein